MNGQRRLVWHIGHHKTGSTSIQNTLAAGGVRVPGTNLLYPGTHHNYLVPHFRAWSKRGKVRPGSSDRPGLGKVSRLLAESDFDLAIFSAEGFEGADAGQFGRMLDEFFLPHVSELQIVVYLRPHAARTRSSFAENVKLGDFDGDLSQFHESFRERIRYTARLAPWQERFGSALTVRPMVRDRLVGGSAVKDFMSTVLGPGTAFEVTADRSVNESLSLEQLLVIREFQRQLDPEAKPMRRNAGRALGRLMAAGDVPGWNTSVALHRSLAEEICLDHLADARMVDATYFADHPVMEAELLAEVDAALDEPQVMDARAHLSADVCETARVLGQMFQVAAASSSVPAHRLFRAVAETVPGSSGGSS